MTELTKQAIKEYLEEIEALMPQSNLQSVDMPLEQFEKVASCFFYKLEELDDNLFIIRNTRDNHIYGYAFLDKENNIVKKVINCR